MECTEHFLGIDWTNHLKPVEAHYYRQYTKSQYEKKMAIIVKRLERNECPECGTAMSYAHEPTGPEFFSHETGDLHQNFKTQYECPACGFVVPSTDEDVPF